LEYPTNIMVQKDGEYHGYQVSSGELGTTTVTVTNGNLSNIRLYFETAKTVSQMVRYSNRRYGIEISDVNISSGGGLPMHVESSSGVVSVKNQVKYVLQTEGGTAVVDEAGLGRVLANY